MQLPALKAARGFVGIRDSAATWCGRTRRPGGSSIPGVHLEDPVVQQQRTKSMRLLHKQLCKDSAMSGQGLADYIVTFRKPGQNEIAIAGELDHYSGDAVDVSRAAWEKDADAMRAEGKEPWPYSTWVSIMTWQRYASPVWTDIRQTRTLQYRSARTRRTSCTSSPLQLDVIERCIDLWSNPGETVLTPFMGIGSEVYCSLEGRRGVGFELKASYWRQAVLNIQRLDDQLMADLLGLRHDFLLRIRGRQLLANGYLIIPIKPGHKRPALDAADRTARVSDLGRFPGARPGRAVRAGCRRWPGWTSTQPARRWPRRFTAWCQENLGFTAERVGNAPKIPTGLPGRARRLGQGHRRVVRDADGGRHRLEILGRGQQFVAYATHPDTGQPYEWVDLVGGLGRCARPICR